MGWWGPLFFMFVFGSIKGNFSFFKSITCMFQMTKYDVPFEAVCMLILTRQQTPFPIYLHAQVVGYFFSFFPLLQNKRILSLQVVGLTNGS